MKHNVEWEKWNLKENNFIKSQNIKSRLIYGKFHSTRPKVSVMLLTYKRAGGLKRALDSAIHQDYEEAYEIVVVDDSGFDQESDQLMKLYCEKYDNIVYYRHDQNLGQYDNWNRACELCRSDWYCLLHDDDMMKPNYLSQLTKVAFMDTQAGLIGSYMETVDERLTSKKTSLVDRLVNIFIKMRNGKSIELTLNDNMRHIFVLSCCLFINRKKALEIGGLNDEFFPSSDFFFAAKMNCYYKTLFLPIVLSSRGIGENESLKQQVCDDSIRCGFQLTKVISQYKNDSNISQRRKASIAAVNAEIGVKGYNNVDYGQVKKELGMNSLYNNKFVILLINIYSKLRWGLLLLR
ncbi:MAG: glycosyltransferase family 2 protein [Bacilli bacterium]